MQLIAVTKSPRRILCLAKRLWCVMLYATVRLGPSIVTRYAVFTRFRLDTRLHSVIASRKIRSSLWRSRFANNEEKHFATVGTIHSLPRESFYVSFGRCLTHGELTY